MARQEGWHPTWPYSVAVVPGKDRAVVSLAEMGMPGQPFVTNNQVQVWSVSKLKVVATVDLPAQAQGEHHIDPAEPRVLADGTVYVGTFTCGVWRIDDVNEGATGPRLCIPVRAARRRTICARCPWWLGSTTCRRWQR